MVIELRTLNHLLLCLCDQIHNMYATWSIKLCGNSKTITNTPTLVHRKYLNLLVVATNKSKMMICEKIILNANMSTFSKIAKLIEG